MSLELWNVSPINKGRFFNAKCIFSAERFLCIPTARFDSYNKHLERELIISRFIFTVFRGIPLTFNVCAVRFFNVKLVDWKYYLEIFIVSYSLAVPTGVLCTTPITEICDENEFQKPLKTTPVRRILRDNQRQTICVHGRRNECIEKILWNELGWFTSNRIFRSADKSLS